MKKLLWFLPILLISVFAFSGCVTLQPQPPYVEDYVLVVNGVVDTNENGQYRTYSFTSSGFIIESLQTVIAYKLPGQPASSSINASCSINENVYTLSWGILFLKKEEVWNFNSTLNEFVREGEEGKKLVPISVALAT